MDRMTQGDRPGPGMGLRGGPVLWLLVVLLTPGCQSTTRTLDPDDRQLEPPPFAKFADDPKPADDDDGGDAEKESDGQGGGPTEAMSGEEDDDPGSDTWPNVQDPGPDMANFPN